jgi:hypothetical protein
VLKDLGVVEAVKAKAVKVAKVVVVAAVVEVIIVIKKIEVGAVLGAKGVKDIVLRAGLVFIN